MISELNALYHFFFFFSFPHTVLKLVYSSAFGQKYKFEFTPPPMGQLLLLLCCQFTNQTYFNSLGLFYPIKYNYMDNESKYSLTYPLIWHNVTEAYKAFFSRA